ncbi:hypothetical protein CTheo_8311 [Ceratobasidium theobromae]|uniref:Uncharacterized protein n=1 Tax=Ceratobasidium theobromae TaxID=1582974 RepID=A0A5N5Q945_9AGAM|nr:hypothetical protein CTheo_8311 [Ceratobasidium theobromae]
MPKDSSPAPIAKKPGKSSVDAPPTSKPKATNTHSRKRDIDLVTVTRSDQDPVSWAIIEKPENVSNCKLMEAMRLHTTLERRKEYLDIKPRQSRIRRDAITMLGDDWGRVVWSEVPLIVKCQVTHAATERFEYLLRFKHNWAAEEIMKRALRNSRDREARARKATKQIHTLKVSGYDSTAAVDGRGSNEAAEDIEEAGSNNSGDNGLTDNTDAEATRWDAGEDGENSKDGEGGENSEDDLQLPRAQRRNLRRVITSDDETDLVSDNHTPPTSFDKQPSLPSSPVSAPNSNSFKKRKSDSLDRADSWAGKAQQEIAELEDVRPMKKARGKKASLPKARPQSPTPSVAAAAKPAAAKPTAPPTAKPATTVPKKAATQSINVPVKKAATTSTSAKSNKSATNNTTPLTSASAAPTGRKPYPKMVKLPVSGKLEQAVTSRATKEEVLDSIEASTTGRTTRSKNAKKS